jgi:hypothetical protein
MPLGPRLSAYASTQAPECPQARWAPRVGLLAMGAAAALGVGAQMSLCQLLGCTRMALALMAAALAGILAAGVFVVGAWATFAPAEQALLQHCPKA